MTYRDDHDAALHRAAALERELAAERKRADAAAARAERLEAELRTARAPAPAPRYRPATRRGNPLVAFFLAIVAIPIVVLLAGHGHTSYTPPPPYLPPPMYFPPPPVYVPPPPMPAIEVPRIEVPAPVPPPAPHHHHRHH